MGQRAASHQSDPNREESCIFCHTMPRRGTSSDWPDSCCYMRTQHKTGTYPNQYRTEWHKLSAYPPTLGWFSLSAHLSEGDKPPAPPLLASMRRATPPRELL